MLSQKANLLCLYEILRKFSDEDHPISADKIIEKMKVIYDVDIERRAVYRNISVLNEMGIQIVKATDNRGGYCLIEREFDTSEIRLLCDAVASSKFIPENEGRQIIRKLLKTQSVFAASVLKGTIYLKSPERVNNMQIFYNIDMMNVAISQCLCASSELTRYNINKVPETYKKITISPYCTVWANNCYYVICHDKELDKVTHYRLDKMKNIKILEYEFTPPEYGFSPSEYTRKMIYLEGEEERMHEIVCSVDEVDSLIDRFGKNISISRISDNEVMVMLRTTEKMLREWKYSKTC